MAKLCRIGLERGGDGVLLAFQPVIINAGAATGPRAGIAAENSHGDSGCRGGVGNPHFPHQQDIRLILDGFGTDCHGMEHLIPGHGRACGEISGWCVEVNRVNLQFGLRRPGQLVDGRTAMAEIGDHLGRNLGWKGGNTLRRNPVITGKNQAKRVIDPRLFHALPGGQKNGNILKPAQ